MGHSKKATLSRRKLFKLGAFTTAVMATGLHPSFIANADTNQNPPKNPEQIGFRFDQGKCVGCRNCMAACKKTNKWEEGTQWRRVLQAEKGRIFLSISCNHCENPVCATVCPVKAYTKRDKDGIVVQDPEKCIGCKYCMYACPYHAPQFSDATGRISKCHFCFSAQDAGGRPACVGVCPTEALSFGKLTELRSASGTTAELKGLPNPALTKPSWVLVPKA